MKKLFFIGCSIVAFISCNTTPKEKQNTSQELEVYQPSEMALLMNEFYAFNEQIKKDIEAGRQPEKSSVALFQKIHTAALTDPSDRDASFEVFAKMFVKAENDIFDSISEQPIKDRYNKTINACISCHKTTCHGPIPRIKKLLIR
jgi:cytochrome c553